LFYNLKKKNCDHFKKPHAHDDIMTSQDVQYPLVSFNAVDPLGFKGYLTKAGVFAGFIGMSDGQEYMTAETLATDVMERTLFQAGAVLCGVDMDFTGQSSAVGLIITPNQSYILLPTGGTTPGKAIVQTDGSILTQVKIDVANSSSLPVLSTTFSASPVLPTTSSEQPVSNTEVAKDTSKTSNVMTYVGIGVAVVVALVFGAMLLKGDTSLETFDKAPPTHTSNADPVED
jgi:hypothetical protein